jgi:hypothetical protein
MIEPKEVERLRRHLVALTAKADDADAFAIIAAMQDEWSEILAAQARKINSEGVSWAEIAKPLGIRRTSAHSRYATTPGAKGYRGSNSLAHPDSAKRLTAATAVEHKLMACPPASAPGAVKSSPE